MSASASRLSRVWSSACAIAPSIPHLPVRKISHGVGVERTFQTYSPLVAGVTVKRRGDVRQAKLYYLRKLTGRAARIAEKLGKKEQT